MKREKNDKDFNVSPSENPQEESVEVKEEANKVIFADLGSEE